MSELSFETHVLRVRTRQQKTRVKPIVFELHTIRVAKRLSRAQLAAKMGYASRTIERWESGESVPNFHALHDWCQGLGVRLTVR